MASVAEPEHLADAPGSPGPFEADLKRLNASSAKINGVHYESVMTF